MSNKFIPFYFPQLHAIPENNKWWGENYTDWDRVKVAPALTKNHHQPRIPLNHNYYDQSLADTIKWQIDLATSFNIYGLNFYHYWFNGKLLLEKPIQLFKNINHDLKYCITWANETWSKRWDGKFNEILIKQEHAVDYDEWTAHFNYLIQFFEDERYIRIDAKPVFLIYRPDIFPQINAFLKFLEDKCKERGLPGIYAIGIKAYETTNKDVYNGFDAVLKFQPRIFFGKGKGEKTSLAMKVQARLRHLPEKYQLILGDLKYKLQRSTSYSIDDFWKSLLHEAKLDLYSEKKIYESVLTDWDNTARYGIRAKYFSNASPEKFEYYLKELIETLSKDNRGQDNYIFINAWNEWSEGAYLEPDEKNQYKYLEVLKRLAI